MKQDLKMNYDRVDIAFATQHHKDKIISALFKDNFNAQLIVPPNIDTDQFGTFTGEIQRPSDIKQVLRKKAELGLKATGLQLGLANEGSFGPHPNMPWLECNQETFIFVDARLEIEIFANVVSLENRAEYSAIEDEHQLISFLEKINFGPQAVIVKPSPTDTDVRDYIFKGLTDQQKVLEAIRKIKTDLKQKSVWIETDNRAHLSPKRQAVILKSAENLVQLLKSKCPGCEYPGFEIKDFIMGMKCESCGLKSEKPAQEIWGCPNSKCDFEEVKERSDGLKFLKPEQCDWCNP